MLASGKQNPSMGPVTKEVREAGPMLTIVMTDILWGQSKHTLAWVWNSESAPEGSPYTAVWPARSSQLTRTPVRWQSLPIWWPCLTLKLLGKCTGCWSLLPGSCFCWLLWLWVRSDNWPVFSHLVTLLTNVTAALPFHLCFFQGNHADFPRLLYLFVSRWVLKTYSFLCAI